MKRRVLLIAVITLSSMSMAMQKKAAAQTAAQLEMRKCYIEKIKMKFKPTTLAFLEKQPNAPESKILQRYIDEFVNNAIKYRKKDLPADAIGDAELFDAYNYTPTDEGRLGYILTGQGSGGGLSTICAPQWFAELKKIEDKIAINQ